MDSSFNTNELLYWVQELQRGRPNAAAPTFRKILQRVERMVRQMTMRYPRVKRFVDVDDIVQNTLMRLLRAMEAVRPTSTRHFYALTTELIRRELLDLTKHFYRESGPGNHLAEVPVGDGPGEHAAIDGESAIDWDAFANFHEMLEKLPTEQREVLGLTYYHGWKSDDIANLFQVSARTVQRWLEDAKATLRQRSAERA